VRKTEGSFGSQPCRMWCVSCWLGLFSPCVLLVFSFFWSPNGVFGRILGVSLFVIAREFWNECQTCTYGGGGSIGTFKSFFLIGMWGQRFLFCSNRLFTCLDENSSRYVGRLL